MNAARFRPGIASMCRWLTAHRWQFVERARAANGGLRPGQLGPLNELALTVFALADLDCCPELDAWRAEAASALAREVERMAPYLDWDRYDEAVQADPLRCLAWLFVPVAGRQPQISARLARDLDNFAPKAALSQDPCFCFFMEVLGVRDCSVELRVHVSRSIRPRTSLSRPQLYDITHALFYFTHFGRRRDRRIQLPPDLLQRLMIAALDRLAEGDYDLSAEIVVSLLCTGYEIDSAAIQVAEAICEHLSEDGGVVSTRGADQSIRHDFASIYHPTLVCLMAVAEVHRSRAAVPA